MSETLWGVDLVQSLLPLPELTCSWLRGICVCMCVGMDAPRAVTACCDRVGKVGARGRCGLREGFASPRVVACASLPPGVCATVLSGTRC